MRLYCVFIKMRFFATVALKKNVYILYVFYFPLANGNCCQVIVNIQYYVILFIFRFPGICQNEFFFLSLS